MSASREGEPANKPQSEPASFDDFCREEREKALSSPEHFADYLRETYERGSDILPLPGEGITIADNWRALVEDRWDMARELGSPRHPPPLPHIDSEASAKSAIDQLITWTNAIADARAGESVTPADALSFDTEQAAILKVLLNSGNVKMTSAMIEAEIRLNEKTIRKNLKFLQERKLVDYPAPKKGYCLTKKGRAEAQRLPPSAGKSLFKQRDTGP